jgi:hypothetical protein
VVEQDRQIRFEGLAQAHVHDRRYYATLATR